MGYYLMTAMSTGFTLVFNGWPAWLRSGSIETWKNVENEEIFLRQSPLRQESETYGEIKGDWKLARMPGRLSMQSSIRR